MCGICGLIDYKNVIDNGEEALIGMRDAMIHRGPDNAGVYINKRGLFAGLGHRRLSIIDLSSAGHQPMANEDNTVYIVLNGEIYNYQELRKRLERDGHSFSSDTDTEVVVHLYEEHGKECVKFLRGMFAFAVWDDKKRSLFLARDRVGKKPLFYYHSEELFIFASELSALMRSGKIKKEMNNAAVHNYLTFGYIPAPLTIYNNVFKLPAAHTLVLNDKNMGIERYWSLNFANKIKISEKDAADEILRLLGDAVRIRLRSDVPLGAFLSGGIDSSIIVALMSKMSEKKVKTFSIGFKEDQYNELKYARLVSEKFQTEHNEFMVEPNAIAILPLLVERYGEPYADSSCIPTYYVSRETRRYVTVALNGDGGDELFGGYERYQAMAFSEGYHKMPGALKKIVSLASSLLPDSINPKNRLRNLKRFFEVIDMPMAERYLRWTGVFDASSKDAIYSDGFKSDVRSFDPLHVLTPYLESSGGLEIVDRSLLTDTNVYLPYDLLVKVDIASMANSLEARSPFLDHNLMEFAASLPANYKVRGLTKKYILKRAIGDMLPRENIHRRKMGFGVPIGEWFRKEMKSFVYEVLLSEKSLGRGYFKQEAIADIVTKHIEGRADHAHKIWALIMLELWHKRFID
jgi:asparagine synthase (glutamine-hydrolysing)